LAEIHGGLLSHAGDDSQPRKIIAWAPRWQPFGLNAVIDGEAIIVEDRLGNATWISPGAIPTSIPMSFDSRHFN
jgi:hypothetical protein